LPVPEIRPFIRRRHRDRMQYPHCYHRLCFIGRKDAIRPPPMATRGFTKRRISAKGVMAFGKWRAL
jgi:hypothetical protein